MGRTSKRRANVLVGVGAALLIVGVAAAASLGRSNDRTPEVDTVSVVVARADLEVGALGDDLLTTGKVGVDQVPADEVSADAMRSTSALSGALIVTAVAKGEEVPKEAVTPSTLRAGAITIPEGRQAVAITVDTTAGGGGYAGAGDHVDLYTVIQPDAPGSPVSPMTKLLIADVEVLDVSNEIAPRRASSTTTEETTVAPRTTSGQITLLLALTPKEAEQAIFATNFNSVWFTVLPKGAPKSSTDGVTYDAGYVADGT